MPDEIARLLGISRATLFRHMKEDPQFREAIQRGRAQGALDNASFENMVFETLVQAPEVTESDVDAAGFGSEHQLGLRDAMTPKEQPWSRGLARTLAQRLKNQQ